MSPDRVAERVAQAVRVTHHASQIRGIWIGVGLTILTGLLYYEWQDGRLLPLVAPGLDDASSDDDPDALANLRANDWM